MKEWEVNHVIYYIGYFKYANAELSVYVVWEYLNQLFGTLKEMVMVIQQPLPLP